MPEFHLKPLAREFAEVFFSESARKQIQFDRDHVHRMPVLSTETRAHTFITITPIVNGEVTDESARAGGWRITQLTRAAAEKLDLYSWKSLPIYSLKANQYHRLSVNMERCRITTQVRGQISGILGWWDILREFTIEAVLSSRKMHGYYVIRITAQEGFLDKCRSMWMFSGERPPGDE